MHFQQARQQALFLWILSGLLLVAGLPPISPVEVTRREFYSDCSSIINDFMPDDFQGLPLPAVFWSSDQGGPYNLPKAWALRSCDIAVDLKPGQLYDRSSWAAIKRDLNEMNGLNLRYGRHRRQRLAGELASIELTIARSANTFNSSSPIPTTISNSTMDN